MGDWLSYSLSDFLLFSPAAYWRLFEQLNAAVWPLQPLLMAVLAGVVTAAVAGWRRAGLAAGLCLAISWALVAHLFLAVYYAPINWAIDWILPFVWLQAGLAALLAPGLTMSGGGRTPWAPYGLIALALAYPLVGALAGRPLAQAEIAGLAPDPTALLSLGLVGLARQGWRRAALSVLPLLWLMISAATLFAMEEAAAWVLIAGLGLAASGLARGR